MAEDDAPHAPPARDAHDAAVSGPAAHDAAVSGPAAHDAAVSGPAAHDPAAHRHAVGTLPVERWRLLIAYDGSSFRGFAAQPGVRTVAGDLADALARITRSTSPPLLTCAGRTDAGVHARGQVVHVDLATPLATAPSGGARGAGVLEPDRLIRSLNRQLAPAIVVRSASRAPADFDARRSATGRHYRYLVWNDEVADPLLAHLAWHVPEPLDLRAMTAATDSLLGTHDFRAFCRRPPGTPADQPITRVVTAARWSLRPQPDSGPSILRAAPVAPAAPDEDRTPDLVQAGRLLRFDIEAGSFCHQMVRSLVGHLVGVGRGRGNVATTVALLRSGGRSPATVLAPPHGLCLTSVSYG